MRNIKKQDGVITMLVLITVIFLLSFLISAYLLISNKLKNEQDIVSETKRIYEGTASMDEIYNSYIGGEIIPIYDEEQLVRIGSGENYQIDGKYYTLSKDDTYVLMNDISFNPNNITYLQGKEWIPIGNQDIRFDGNGKEISIMTASGGKKKYNENTKYSYGIAELATESDYISNGLLVHLDGIQNTLNGHSASTTMWYDLKENNNFQIFGCEIGSNSLIFNTGDYCMSEDVINPQYATIEVIYKPTFNNTVTGEICVAYNAEGGGFGIVTANTYITRASFYVNGYKTNSNAIVNKDEIAQVVASFDGNKIKLYKNANFESSQIAEGTIGAPINNTHYGLGCNPKGTTIQSAKFEGEIYSVRIYNRALTEEEIAQNYVIDKERYGL